MNARTTFSIGHVGKMGEARHRERKGGKEEARHTSRRAAEHWVKGGLPLLLVSVLHLGFSLSLSLLPAFVQETRTTRLRIAFALL